MAAYLKQIRTDAGLTQKRLSEILYLAESQLSKLERRVPWRDPMTGDVHGRIRNRETILAWARACGVPVDSAKLQQFLRDHGHDPEVAYEQLASRSGDDLATEILKQINRLDPKTRDKIARTLRESAAIRSRVEAAQKEARREP